MPPDLSTPDDNLSSVHAGKSVELSTSDDAVLTAIQTLASEVRLLRHPLPPSLLTLSQAGEVIGRSKRVVRKYIESGWLTGVRLPAADGRREGWMVAVGDIEEFVDRRRVRAKSGTQSASKPTHSRATTKTPTSVNVPRLIE